MTLSVKPYIGSRDFYPEETRFRNWMFSIQKELCSLYGYREYGAPILELMDLYRSKSSEEIVNEQLYSFTDRGDREVAIRPEMTPTLARMVAAKKNEIPFPARWFSIANFMRYERPGRGRLREFYQLNVDLLGVSGPSADAEILSIAGDLLRSYGAPESSFELRVSDRRFFDSFFKDLPQEKRRELGRLLDKREKIGQEAFARELETLNPEPAFSNRVEQFLKLSIDDLKKLVGSGELEESSVNHFIELNEIMQALGRGNDFRFDPGIIRGFDYYTGLIFEINDTHPENRRALFGGGRYDRLLGLFGKEDIPAVGFGMGDVTLENFLEGHGLIPAHLTEPAGNFIALMDPSLLPETMALAERLRKNGIPIEVSLEAQGKLKKQFQLAEKKGYRKLLLLGSEELEKKIVRVKDLVTGEQIDVPLETAHESLGG